ncbi:hypothetical protein O6H91_15G003300 [Diphasiastrum complanatum]|uniref:Uncharacterized protein n=2 Tax=Diphasiastrum complanatum TaxID=34168 RepID=A0ACC2BFD9_DIPCM|nr:hypothetical protein O6H91_15G003300 [Diphasiastrum complanatum]KAJ7528431.1 hypothetical protein O6H91_15G003300 [Diphasiastrum complanatum]
MDSSYSLHSHILKTSPSDKSFFVLWVVAWALVSAWWLFMHRFRQRHSKGPKTWPILGCIPEQAKNFDKLHDWLLHYFRATSTYSVPMVTINNTFTVDPANVEHILKTNFSNYPKGAKIRERFEPVLGNGIFNVDGDLWWHQRKVAILEFSSSKLRDYSIHAFRDQALKLVEVLWKFAKRGETVDLQDLFMRLTLDSICKVGFGVDVGCLSPLLPKVPFATAFDEANELVIKRYIDVFWKLKRALNVGSEARLRQCVQVIDSFLYKVIETRKVELNCANAIDHGEVKADLLSRFMSKDGEEVYSDKMLRDIVINFIIAGRDTTALTLSWFFSLLCKHPHVVEKILSEVAEVLGENASEHNGESETDKISEHKLHGQERGLGDDIVQFAQMLNYQTLNKMHYLHAALTETLRLYPAVPLETKEVAADDVLPDGTQLKGGNWVSYVPYSMGRLEQLWGPDVNEFKPERWLRNGTFQPQSPFKLTAFQAGPRICLGKDSAYLQMKMTAVLLLRFFQFQLVDHRQIDYRMMVVLYIASGLEVHISQR